MGWAGGSSMLYELLDIIHKHLPEKPKKRRKVMEDLIDLFEQEDCDTIPEAFDDDRWPELEAVYRDLHPEEFEDEAE